MFRFDNVIVRPEQRELTVGSEPVHLEPLAFEVLLYLLDHRDRVVTKEELLDNLWGDRFVSESALSTRIKAVRRAVGDDGRSQRVIKTFHGRGYRLVAEVTAEVIADEAVLGSGGGAGPAPTTPTVTSNLPNQRVDLVGRDEVLNRLVAAWETSDLLTIVGPGGVGKTTLAVALGHRLSSSVDGRVVLCELASVDGDRVADAVLDVIEGTGGSVGSTPAAIAARLGTEPTILLLDNCEHVVDQAADLVEGLLDHATALTVVATSREPLTAEAEVVVRLDGLDPGSAGDGVELLRQRAGAATAIRWSAADEETARQIVSRLDGLPLAIELAAPKLATMTPAELLAALEDQMGLLTARRRRAGRHSTMHDTIDWSYRLLADEERRTLGELSVFVDAFTADGAQAVCSLSWAVPTLHRLVEQSVVARIDGAEPTRYRMLEPVRQYVRAVVDRADDAEDWAAVGQRHAEYVRSRVVGIARGLATGDEGRFATQLSRQWRDLGAATEWGRDNDRVDIAVDPLVELGFHLLWQLRIEGYHWLEEAVSVFGDEVADRDDVTVARAMGAWSARDLDRSERLLATVTDPATPEVAFARYNQLMARDDYERLVDHTNTFVDIATRAGSANWTAVAAATSLVAAAINHPDDAETEARLEAARRLATTSTWGSGRCWLLLAELTTALSRRRADEVRALWPKLEAAAAGAQAPWFTMTAAALASAVDRRSDPLERLEVAVATLQTSLDADDLVQVPLFLRLVVIGLADTGHAEEAARIIGLLPSVHGVGESGRAVYGFRRATADIEAELGADRFAALAAEGRDLTLSAAADQAARALARSRAERTATETD